MKHFDPFTLFEEKKPNKQTKTNRDPFISVKIATL